MDQPATGSICSSRRCEAILLTVLHGLITTNRYVFTLLEERVNGQTEKVSNTVLEMGTQFGVVIWAHETLNSLDLHRDEHGMFRRVK